jgi:hypothetical protein
VPQFVFDHVHGAFRDQEDANNAMAQIDSADIEYRFIDAGPGTNSTQRGNLR